MGAISKNKYDVYKWLFDVIESCTSILQLITAKKLMRLYFKKYDFNDIMYQTLYQVVDTKYSFLTTAATFKAIQKES